jgi:hypothetical protein
MLLWHMLNSAAILVPYKYIELMVSLSCPAYAMQSALGLSLSTEKIVYLFVSLTTKETH